MRRLVPIFSAIMGLYWIAMGLKYGFWVRKGPGGGFLPIIAGVLAIIFSLIVLISQRKEKASSSFSWKAFLPAGALVGLILCSFVVGMIISMAVYIIVWLRFIEKHTVKSSLTIGLGCAAVIYVIFVMWLRVPLPTGLLGLV